MTPPIAAAATTMRIAIERPRAPGEGGAWWPFGVGVTAGGSDMLPSSVTTAARPFVLRPYEALCRVVIGYRRARDDAYFRKEQRCGGSDRSHRDRDRGQACRRCRQAEPVS